MPLFITFEGGEGCGKSTQAKLLHKWLTDINISVLLTHEPGGTPIGDRICRLLKWARQDIAPMAELMLFNASRAQLVAGVIRPALESGQAVICDRFADSTVAYQGYGRGLDIKTVISLNEAATGGLKPDLTVLLDIPPEIGLERKNRVNPDRFQREEIAFHRRVREGYLKLARSEPDRWLAVDAVQGRVTVSETIRQRVENLMAGKKAQGEESN